MIFDVYCDESRPDLLSSKKPGAQYMLIGSLWLPNACRDEYKKEIHALGNKHKIGGEFKWQKISPSRLNFYKELIDWFFDKKDQLRFRCIAVDHSKVDLQTYHLSDQELGFYKFYYQLLHHWIQDFNEYNIFIDFKLNRRRDRLSDLRSCLASANLSSKVNRVQAIGSNESVLLQLADVLTGISAYRLNNGINIKSAKHELLLKCEELLGKPISNTAKSVHKFNVFEIDLSGGW
ncbi:MAG: DUF3800 domain-containing protein [Planctomycetota bacterium]|nr:MAG: DUF3800 domain-containing protein [Planctomycetota bacterium]